MVKAYKYLYYHLYSWNLKTWGKSDVPEYNALFGVSFMVFINLGVVPLIVDTLLDIDVINTETPKVLIVVVLLTVLVMNYFVFIYKQKYKQLAKEYKEESKALRRKRTVMIWSYVIFSFGIYLVLGRL